MRNILWIFVVAACGGDGGVDLADYDPRCVAVCTDDPPSLDGAYDVCDSASQVSCLDLCEARIAGQMSLCQTCLLENADYDPDGDDDGPGANCNNTTCTISGRGGTCSYPVNDSAARDNCLRQVYPRREVACTVEFRPVSECASSCQM